MKHKELKISLLITGLIFLGVVIFAQPIWRVLAGPEDLGDVDFAAIAAINASNAYLLCPEHVCRDAPARPPVFDRPAAELMQRAKATWTQAYRNALVHEDTANLKLRFVHRSAVFGLPDTIVVQFLQMSDTTSTLAIYSRSQIGAYDFGVNKRRIERWLAELAA